MLLSFYVKEEEVGVGSAHCHVCGEFIIKVEDFGFGIADDVLVEDALLDLRLSELLPLHFCKFARFNQFPFFSLLCGFFSRI